MWRRWYSTVLGLRNSAAAVSRVVLRAASRSPICSSWGVSASTVLGTRRRSVSPVAASSVRARAAPGPARGRERRWGAVGPGPRVEALERLHRRAQLLAGAHPLARATQPLAVGQPRARRLEAVRGPRVLGERGLEAGREVVVDHRPGAQPPRE